jgi:CubicO group peptidase (beta-lactamase class C family)
MKISTSCAIGIRHATVWFCFLLAPGRLAVAGAGERPANPDYSAIISEFRASIPKLMRAQRIPGVALAVVDNREMLWLASFGFTDDDRRIPITPDTLFSVQSMSKNFTAAAVLVAVQDGLLDLDKPIAEYLPGFIVNSRFEEHPERKMTLRLLLSHRAGFTHEAPVGSNYDFDSTSFPQHIASISRTWLRFPVGQRFSYSNLGIDLAGEILRLRSGVPFQQYLKQKLLDPIGMTASTFDKETIRLSPQRAIGHSALPRESLQIPMISAGGLYTSARELARYVQFHLNGGRTNGAALIDDELLRQMYAIPAPFPRQTSGFGLGIIIERIHGAVRLGHSGGGFGFESNMVWYPAFRLGIAILTNSGNMDNTVAAPLPYEILDRFVETKLGHAFAKTEEEVQPETHGYQMPPLRQRTLAGQYLLDFFGGPMTFTFQAGGLGIRRDGRFAPVRWMSEDAGVVPVNGRPVFLQFVRKADGTPLYVMRQNDGEFLDYNEGVAVPGPDKPEWRRYTGKYRIKQFGQPVEAFEVQIRNGNLLLENLKLAEYRPGLFFTPHGEALDFRSVTPTWRNIPLEKVVISPALVGSLALCEAIFLSALLAGPATFVARRMARREKAAPRPFRKWLGSADRLSAALVAALEAMLIYLLLTRLSVLVPGGLSWSPRWPLAIKASLLSLTVAAVLPFLLPVFALLARKAGIWNRLELLHYWIVTIAALFVSGVLIVWNLPKWPV